MKFWWNQFAIGKVGGWRYYYSRISSPVSLNLLLRLGAQIIADVDVVGTNGKHKMWMIQIDLQKPFPSYSNLASLMSQNTTNNKPKLWLDQTWRIISNYTIINNQISFLLKTLSFFYSYSALVIHIFLKEGKLAKILPPSQHMVSRLDGANTRVLTSFGKIFFKSLINLSGKP